MKQEVQMYKEKVKIHLSSNNNNVPRKLNLIDSIQRLGISYYFEGEIDEILTQIYNGFTNNNNLAIKEGDLHFIALLFRLFRQKGYYISSDVFNKFKNGDGEFDETIVQDIEGMWSLYETAQLRIHGEEILEKAHEFTYNNLKSITNQLSPSLADQINESLIQPLHKAIPRMRARSYMYFYEEDPSHDKVLLNLAKLDFNMLQKLYQKEVGGAVRWWKKSEFARKVPYVRDRIVELFFWASAMNYEPQYSTFREEIIKVIQWMTIVDDTYDVYGTIEELELFTLALQRWDISCIASLPECYKEIFNSTVELFDELIDLSSAVGGESNLVRQYVKHTLVNFVQGYITEARWCHEGYIPRYEEYKANGVFSSGYEVLTSLFIALGGFATKEMLDWMSNLPVMVKASGLVLRLTNDLGSRRFEQQRKHSASAVECCMKQYGFSEKEACEFIKNDINNYWKDLNEEYLKLIEDIPRPVLDCIVNLASICEFLYANNEDKFTDCALLKDHIEALLLDPVVV